MLIKLDKEQFGYLKLTLSGDRADLAKYLAIKFHDNRMLDIPDEIADEIRDWACEKLQKIGFDKNYELTQEGAILEQLIDLLYM